MNEQQNNVIYHKHKIFYAKQMQGYIQHVYLQFSRINISNIVAVVTVLLFSISAVTPLVSGPR